MKVYEKIAAITAELSKVGISKDRRNTQGSGYNFRGIDDVYAALSPLLAKHGLCILPRVLSRELREHTSKNGGALFYTVLNVEFDIIAAEDGSKHTACIIGEAMDSGDKSTNKAMSAAYKYLAFLMFCIPTEGDNDADSTTHAVVPKGAKAIPEDTIANHIVALEMATTLDELRDAFTSAYKACAGDQDALDRLADVKEARKNALK